MLKRALLLSLTMIIVRGVAPAQEVPMDCPALQTSSPIALSARAGWLTHPKGITLTTHLRNFNQEFVDTSPLEGGWLEITARGAVSNRVGMRVSAGMLTAVASTAREQETVSGTGSESSLSGTSWGSIEGLLSSGVSDSVQVVGGFRWDHFNTRFDFSRSAAFLDFKVNAYVPLIGVRLDRHFPGGSLIVGFTGWPGPIPGHMTQSYVGGPQIQGWDHIEQDLARGYLMECFCAYRRTLFDSASAGVFVRWNSLHLGTNEDRYDWQVTGTQGTGPVTETFDRRSWTVGGSLTLDFALPTFR